MRASAPGAQARAFVLLFWLSSAPAFAGDAPIRPDSSPIDPTKNRIFFFAGSDVARDSAFGWAGVVTAPFGRLDEDGLRVRISAGVGRYRYRTPATSSGLNEASVASGELLAGFHRSSASGAITVYLGSHVQQQRLAEPDAGNSATGAAFGLKAAIETYARLDPVWLVNASASASSVHRTYHLRAAVLRELPPAFAAGIEATLLGDVRYVESRAGILASAAYGKSMLTLAGGVLSNSDRGPGIYATLSLYAPY
jgi:hypothetical protein